MGQSILTSVQCRARDRTLTSSGLPLNIQFDRKLLFLGVVVVAKPQTILGRF